jgi:hypothetical protein
MCSVSDNPRPDRPSILRLLTSPLVVVTLVTIVGGSFSLGFLDPTLADYLSQVNIGKILFKFWDLHSTYLTLQGVSKH